MQIVLELKKYWEKELQMSEIVKLICPVCKFSKDVSRQHLPSTAKMVTCPQCSHRFPMEVEDKKVDVSTCLPPDKMKTRNITHINRLHGVTMQLRTATLLVVVCMIFSFMIDVYSIAENINGITWKHPLRVALQLPIIIFFSILWNRQRAEK